VKLQFQLECFAQLPDSVGMIWTDMDAVDGRRRDPHPALPAAMYSAYEAVPDVDSCSRNAGS